MNTTNAPMGWATRISNTLCLLCRRFFICYGLLVLSLSFVGTLINENNIMFCGQLLWIALFAFLISLAFAITDILCSKKINILIVRAVHCVLSYAFYLLTFVAGDAAESYFKATSAGTNRAFMVICMTFLFIGVYAAVGFIRIGFTALKNRKIKKAEHYERIYTDSSSL